MAFEAGPQVAGRRDLARDTGGRDDGAVRDDAPGEDDRHPLLPRPVPAVGDVELEGLGLLRQRDVAGDARIGTRDVLGIGARREADRRRNGRLGPAGALDGPGRQRERQEEPGLGTHGARSSRGKTDPPLSGIGRASSMAGLVELAGHGYDRSLGTGETVFSREAGATGMTEPNVPMVDLKAQYARIEAELAPELARVLASAHFIKGEDCGLLRAGVRRLLRRGPRLRRGQRDGRPDPRAAGLRRRPGGRGGDGRQHVHRHRGGDPPERRPAGVRGRRPRHLHDGRGPGGGGHHAPDEGDPARPPLRPSGGHGRHGRGGGAPRPAGTRGRRAGPRRASRGRGGRARWATPRASASTRARTWVRTATRAW